MSSLGQDPFRVSVDDWSFLEVSGDDRIDWLQGQVTNDMTQLRPGEPLQFCFCKATGQVIANCWCWDCGGTLLLMCPKVQVGEVLNRFRSLVIIEDVETKDISPEYVWTAVQGRFESGSLQELEVLSWPWICGAGCILKSNEPLSTGLPGLLEPELVEARRIAAGRPEYGKDVSDKTLALELGPAFEKRNISHNKGCYTGQEVIHRIHARGHTNRTWVGLVSDSPLSRGDKIEDLVGVDSGFVTSSAIHPELGPIAAAFIKNDVLGSGTDVTVIHGDAELPATWRHFPLVDD